MSDFYGIKPGAIPGLAEVGTGRFMNVGRLPEETVRHMLEFMEKLRGMCRDDELAFEIRVRHVASVIEDQRRAGGEPTRERIRVPYFGHVLLTVGIAAPAA